MKRLTAFIILFVPLIAFGQFIPQTVRVITESDDTTNLVGVIQFQNTTTAASGTGTVTVSPSGVGDNLGNHTATQALDMFTNDVNNVKRLVIENTDLDADPGPDSSVYIGHTVGPDVPTNAVNNVVIGKNSLTSLETGDDNIAVGSNVLNANTTGTGNIGVGLQSLELSVEGFGDIGIGEWAFRSYLGTSPIGFENTCVGHVCGNTLTNGIQNSFYGAESASAYLGGNNNVAVGYDSFRLVDNGDDNTMLGAQTGRATSGDVSKSIAIGFNSKVTGNNQAVMGGTGADAVSLDLWEMSTPVNPPVNSRRIFTDSGTGKLSVRTSAGATISLEEPSGGGPGSDTDAIHDNVAAEITAITAKTPLVGADTFIIEDSAAANVKKSATIADIRITESQITDLTHTDSTAIHDNVASEISAITEKLTPASADLLIIEDSAAANVKKRLQIGNLPGTPGGATTEVQFNNAGAFDGNPEIFIADGTSTLTSSNLTANGLAIFNGVARINTNITWDSAGTKAIAQIAGRLTDTGVGDLNIVTTSGSNPIRFGEDGKSTAFSVVDTAVDARRPFSATSNATFLAQALFNSRKTYPIKIRDAGDLFRLSVGNLVTGAGSLTDSGANDLNIMPESASNVIRFGVHGNSTILTVGNTAIDNRRPFFATSNATFRATTTVEEELTFLDSSTDPTINGEIRRNGADVKVMTDSFLKNLTSSPVIIRKPSNTNTANDATLNDDPHLTLAVGSSQTWQFEFVVFCTTDATPGIDLAVNGPTASSIDYHVQLWDTDALSKSIFATAYDTEVGALFTSSDCLAKIRGTVVTTAAGNIVLRWAQQVSNATNTTVKRGSYAVFHQIP